MKQEVFGISSLTSAGQTVSLSSDKAEVLNQQFRSVFTKENAKEIPALNLPPSGKIQDLKITTKGTQKLLEDIKPNKASGPDQIPARVLKNCATSIAPILQQLFQKSVDTGSLPADWLHANIVPIYKKKGTGQTPQIIVQFH